MQQVTKDEFFATVAVGNVHPRIDETTLRDQKIVSRWEDQRTREVIGLSKGHGETAEWFLAH